MLDVSPDCPEPPEQINSNEHDETDSELEDKKDEEIQDCLDYIESFYRATNWCLRVPVTLFFCFAYLFNNAGERLRQSHQGRNCTELPTNFLLYFVLLILQTLISVAVERTTGLSWKGRLTHLAFSCFYFLVGFYFLYVLCAVLNDWSKLLRDPECMTHVHKEGGHVFWVAGVLLGVQMSWYLVTFLVGVVLFFIAVCCCQSCMQDWIVIEHDTSRAPLLAG